MVMYLWKGVSWGTQISRDLGIPHILVLLVLCSFEMIFLSVNMLSFFIWSRFGYPELKKQSQTNTLEGGT